MIMATTTMISNPENVEPTKTVTFRSDTLADSVIDAMKREALMNDGIRLSKSGAIRKALMFYFKKMSSNK